MWQLVVLLIFPKIFIVSSLIRSFDDDVNNELVDYTGSSRIRLVNIPQETPLWVLRLGNNEFDNLKLRIASDVEEDDFYDAVEPLIERLEQRQGSSSRRIRKKESAIKPFESNYNATKNIHLKMDIMKIVNKFTLSTNIEPDSYLTESDDDYVSSLALYFKGPYTSLIVKLGINQWHYFITPSPFPEWFYEEHPNITQNGKEKYVNVPDSVQTQFYKVLLRTVKKVLEFPV